MNRVEKAALIEELVEKFSANVNFYITDASGMSVAQTNNLRRLCFERGIEYRVVKNTMVQKAL
ncbi:MAG: large subunit ribosomal protein L10, partial [Nonlabens sp.]